MTAPIKPPLGALCNGCGRCGVKDGCQVGRLAFGAVPAPCPTLIWCQERAWCSLVLREYVLRRVGVIDVPVLEHTLAIGRGCDSEGD